MQLTEPYFLPTSQPIPPLCSLVQVSVKPPDRCLTVYHGALSLSFCRGEVVQERVFLLNADRISTSDGTRSVEDGGNTLWEARRNKEQELVDGSFCAVNVTTLFIPHTVRREKDVATIRERLKLMKVEGVTPYP